VGRGAAEREEVVVDTNPLDAENLAPDLGQDLLCPVAGSDELPLALR
jgi:hypothetical protein